MLLALAFAFTAAAFAADFFFSAAAAVVVVQFLLIGALACLAVNGIHRWRDRDD